jgi:hypothetical protein
LFKGNLKDEFTVKQSGLIQGSKIMCVGSVPAAIENMVKMATEAKAPSNLFSANQEKAPEKPWVCFLYLFLYRLILGGTTSSY